MKNKLPSILLLFLFLFLPNLVIADSPYVLPYPSAMPGGIVYKIHLAWEKLSQYWYFGDFGQFDYNLKESDKYLVEAKTLFEYNQYLLGYNALQKSNMYFMLTLPDLETAKNHGKDITDKRILLSQAADKHIEILEKLKMEVPLTFTWQPEKSNATVLNIKSLIDFGIGIRQKYL